jgi:putative membrane protein
MTVATEVLAHYGEAGGWWPIFPLFWLLVVGTFIFFVVRSRRGWARWGGGPSPEAVLGERYARGEIDASEYRERLTVLKETGRR